MRHARSLFSFALIAWIAFPNAPAQTAPQPLEIATAEAAAGTAALAFDGVVEAVRQTTVAAQVSGAIVELDVKAGERVQAGQTLLRLDARAAEQSASASDAQVQAARAALELAAKDLKRQQQLFQKDYISQAAMERAESAYKSARAQANALLAQAGASRTHSGYHLVRAPFAGVVSEVPVSLGDMAMPGRPLLTLYDPAMLRVTAAVPQSVAAQMPSDPDARVELPGLPAAGAWRRHVKVQVLPTADASTHTVQVRAELPMETDGVAPGMFARLWLPLARGGLASGAAPLIVPRDAIVRRAELTGLYVLDPQDKPVLRQVRLGRAMGDRIEILSGLAIGERVVTNPQAAARVR